MVILPPNLLSGVQLNSLESGFCQLHVLSPNSVWLPADFLQTLFEVPSFLCVLALLLGLVYVSAPTKIGNPGLYTLNPGPFFKT